MCNPTVEHTAHPSPATSAHGSALTQSQQPAQPFHTQHTYMPTYTPYASSYHQYPEYSYAAPHYANGVNSYGYYNNASPSFQNTTTVPNTCSKQLSPVTGEAVSQTSWAKKSQNKGHVFVHDPYSLPACDDEEEEVVSGESPAPSGTDSVHEQEVARVFCSGKGIPTATDEEFLEQIAPIRHLVTEIFRPRGGRKEFLYVELATPEAADVLLSWHPMKFRGSRLNFSRAKPARGQSRGPAPAA
jgi:hypothetical protein